MTVFRGDEVLGRRNAVPLTPLRRTFCVGCWTSNGDGELVDLLIEGVGVDVAALRRVLV